MLPFFPSLLLLLPLLAEPAHLTASTSQELEVRGHRTPRDAKQESIKVIISEGCATQGGDEAGAQGGKEIDLAPGSPLVLTHKIKLVPSGSGSGSGSCGCETDFAALRERLERLEREVSALREKCGGAEGGCCTSKESKGSGCSIKPGLDECPNECSDQGRCVDGKCVCFPGFSGPDCSDSNCPDNCSNNGRCVNGQCVCDPGFAGPDCLHRSCPDNCNGRGRCVNGKCVCDDGYAGPSCSDEACPGNCNNRGRCVNGQCVCNPGFTGPDCSRRGCPDNCNNRGRCVNGKCVCESGYAGDDCSEDSCPGNCNNKGRCVDGECVCDEGFTGDDCTEKICPNDCYDRGRCVDGVCECDSGFTGEDCSEVACPGNCNNKGRCVNGQCVCNEGFAGLDCSQKACPNNCSNRGRCLNGKCVCEAGFTGPDCAAKGCPGNCNNKGRCVKGKCVCRRGFTGPDCSQCEEGMTGPNCDTAMSGVSQLSTQEVTETSVTLVWTPPAVQYETYHITFTSQKEIDQQVTVQVEGSLTTFTQTGLAAGQEYIASITGEIGGRRGAESSTEFMTLISGPSNLRVAKTTSTSAVVHWERSQGEIDRYRLTVTPSDGVGRSQDLTFAPDRDSAHIQELEAGLSYDVVLVAEKGSSRSEAVTTQAVPGNALPNLSMAAVTMQVIPSQGRDVGARDQSLRPPPERQGVDQQGKTEGGSEVDSVRDGSIIRPNKDSTATVVAKLKPLVSRKNGTRPKLPERPVLSRKPNTKTVFRGNGTRVVPGVRKVDPKLLKKFPAGVKTKVPILAKKPKPEAPSIGERTIALTVRDPSVEASSIKSRDENTPAIMSGSDSETNRQGSSEEPAFGPERQPDVGTEVQGSDIDPPPPEPTGAGHSSEKKCMNKIKVAHIRFPDKDRVCKGDGTVQLGKTTSLSNQGSSETDYTSLKHDLQPWSAETVDLSEDPLHKLLTDTFDSLNITTFSVHLSKPADLSSDADTVKKQILVGLKPLSSFSPYSSEASASQSKSAEESSSSSLESTSLITSSPIPTAAASTSSAYLSALASSLLPTKSTSSSSSNSEISDSVERDPSEVASSKVITDGASPGDTKLPSTEGAAPFFRRTSPKGGYIQRLRPNMGPFRNRTNLLKTPYRSNSPLNIPSKGTAGSHSSTRDFSSPSSSSLSAEPDVNASIEDIGGDKGGASAVTSPGGEPNRKKIIMTRGKLPVRRLPPSGGPFRRPLLNKSPFQNRTRPNLRFQISPSRLLKHETATQVEHISTTAVPTRVSPVSAESYPDEGTELVGENAGGNAGESISTELETRDSRPPSSPQINSNVPHSGQPNLYVGPFQKRNRTNLRPPQAPRGVPIRRPSPIRKPSGVQDVTVEGETGQLEKDNTADTPDPRTGEQDSYRHTKVVQSSPSGEAIQSVGDHDSIVPPHSNQLENGESVLTHTSTSGGKAGTPDSNSGDQPERIDDGKNTGPTIRGRPLGKQTDLRRRPSRPVVPPKKQSPGRKITAEGPARVINLSGSHSGTDTQTSHTVKTEPSSDSISLRESDAAREPLDYVRVTNRTSDGFAVTWDAPEGKYKNFIVTRKEVGKDEAAKEGGSRQKLERNQDEEGNHQPITEDTGNENKVPESGVTQVSRTQSNTEAKPETESDKTFKKVLPGSARSFQFEDLPPQTEYTVTLLGKGPGLLSRLHKLVISTGPEPPTDIAFSEVTENSLTVSWTKPKSPVSGFKVTYTHTEEGEPVSVSVDSADSTLGLSRLTPGSTYEVSVISILGLDESDPAKDFAMTLPDAPTNLRAINVTDTKALLLWRPALATVDKYAIVYGSGKDSDLRITVSGNAAEQQLSGLEGSTTYTVTISSVLGSLESSPATTTFTTTGGSSSDGDGPRDLQASNVSPRTALLSWKPPSNPAGSYRLTYQTEGQEMKEVIVGATVTEYNLTRLHPGAVYSVQLQAERGGIYTSAISTEFTTGTLRFPFPSDCSQELLNGIRTSGEVEIFPLGRDGTPMMVYCDMETDGGGWTVFQRRKDGSVDFFRGWKDYIKGFGDLSGEFWLGLDSLHNLTAMTRMSLRIDLQDGGESVFAKYSTFEVARRNYKLAVGGYTGTAGDSFSYHNNRVFSTKDRDPAPFITRCAMSYRGGWWYKNCHEANLNGLYGIDVKHQGIIWTTWKGKETSIAFTEMKMRPAAFSPPARG